MNGSAILLMPLGDSNIAQYATSPMKLVEYMATPIPIVSTNAPSVRGISGRDSIFLSKSHAKDFAEIILKVYNNMQMPFSQHLITLSVNNLFNFIVQISVNGTCIRSL